jgi:hypothetical protein
MEEFFGVYLLDCFTSFAMTGECMTTTLTDPSLRGTKQSSTGEFVGVYLLDCFTSFAMTCDCMTTTLIDPSLRGTKQSSTGRVCQSVIARHEAIQYGRVFRRLSSGLLHFVRNDGRLYDDDINRPVIARHEAIQYGKSLPVRHCEARSNPVWKNLSAFIFWIASLRSQ